MTLHVNFTRFTAAQRKIMRCPTCGRVPHVAFFQDWYGWMITCLRCGDSWQDGEMMPRPFAPRWREKSIASAERRWSQWKAAQKLTRKQEMTPP